MRSSLMVTGAGLFALAACLGGCGSAARRTDPGTGRATITVSWPEASRLVPAACTSIKLQAGRATPPWTMAPKSVDRPPAGGKSVVVLGNLPVGSLLVTATAHPQAGGVGTVQAQASTTITIRAGENTPFALTMASTVDHLDVTPAAPVLFTDGTLQLAATARNAANEIVMVAAANLNWVSQEPAVAQVSATGKVTPVGAGWLHVTVTESESGKSKAVAIPVKRRFSGAVSGNATWSGIVYLTGDVTVPAGSSLTIQPGTRVEVEPNVDDRIGGLNTSRVEVIVDGGTLTSQGTAASPILFTSAGATPAQGDWYGLRLNSPTARLYRCTVEYGQQGLRLEGAAPAIDQCTLRQNKECGAHLQVAGTLTGCTVTANGSSQQVANGVETEGGATCTLSGGLVSNNTGAGVSNQSFVGTSADGAVTISDCTVRGNGAEGIIGWSVRLTRTSVLDNGGSGVWLRGGSATDCTFRGNAQSGLLLYWTSVVVTVTRCVATGNKGGGFNAYQDGSLVVRDSQATNNGGSGISGWALTVSDSVVSHNAGGGLTGADSTGTGGATVSLTRSVVAYNDVGIRVSAVGAEGLTGNLIYANSVGVKVVEPYITLPEPSLTIPSGNDVFGNAVHELANAGTAAVTANGNYWGDPMTAELAAHAVNLTKVYDSRDASTVGQVVITQWQPSRVTTFPLPQ